MSTLPISEKCGLAARLSAEHGAGRAAAMSKAFHAKCAGDPEAFRLMAALNRAEREEVSGWKAPADVELDGGTGPVTLRYADACKELEVALDYFGEHTTDVATAMSVGHLDFAWDLTTTHDLVFVADIKRSVWTTPDGPESLQLHSYGRAFAKKCGAGHYGVGIWAAQEGEWMWSPRIVALDSPEGGALFGRIAYAAGNHGEAAQGPHCDNCYGKLHCPEWLLPATVEAATLRAAGLSDVDSLLDLAPEQVTTLLDWAAKAQALSEHVRELTETAVRRGKLRVINADGKEWRPIEMPGRKSLDVGKLKAAGIDPDEFSKTGAPYVQMRWMKPRKGA